MSHGQQKDRLVSLGLRVKPAHWNAKRREARPAADGADRINEALARALAAGKQALADAAAAAGGSLTTLDVDELRARIEDRLHPERKSSVDRGLPLEQTDLLSYGEGTLERLEAEGRIATARAYRTALGKAREFLSHRRGSIKASALPFAEVTPEFIERFRAWLASPAPHGLGLHANTVHKNVTSLARVWRHAEREGLLDLEGRPPVDPFRRVPVKRVPTRRAKLTPEEVKAIEEVPLTNPAQSEARALWVLALYAGGMRFSDVAMLRREHVSRLADGTFRIAYRMKKTNGIPSLPVAGPGHTILAKYWASRSLESATPKALVFPLLDGYDLTDSQKAFNAVSSQNTLINGKLKEVQVAAEAHIGRPLSAALTFHLARHSLAGRLLEEGWGVYDIRAVMGHASVRATEEYLKGFGRPDLDERLRKLF